MSTVTGVVRSDLTWTQTWNAGEGLWWRDEDGLHGTLLVEEPEYGPKGGRKTPGELVEFIAPSIAAMNEELAELGFGPLSFTDEEDIAWLPKPKPSRYEKALRCRDCGHFLMEHDKKGHDRWHKKQR